MSNEIYRPNEPAYLELHNYDKTVRTSNPHHDLNLGQWLEMVYGALVTVGFDATSTLEGMRDWAKDRLPDDFPEETYMHEEI